MTAVVIVTGLVVLVGVVAYLLAPGGSKNHTSTGPHSSSDYDREYYGDDHWDKNNTCR